MTVVKTRSRDGTRGVLSVYFEKHYLVSICPSAGNSTDPSTVQHEHFQSRSKDQVTGYGVSFAATLPLTASPNMLAL